MNLDKTKDFRSGLLNSESATLFLARAYEIMSEGRTSYSYAQFAQQAGFKARSYGRALVLGLKPLSLNAFLQLIKLFKFDKEHSEYFKYLVALDQQGFHDVKDERADILAKLTHLKRKIERHADRSQSKEKEQVFSSREHLIVYSCISSNEDGTKFKNIVEWSQIAEKICRSILDDLCAKGIVKKLFKFDSYQACESLLIGQMLGGKEFFNEAWIESAGILLEKAKRQMEMRQNLFLSSYFLIPKKEIMTFRQELQELMEKFVDKWCDSPGDEVMELILGVTPIRGIENAEKQVDTSKHT